MVRTAASSICSPLSAAVTVFALSATSKLFLLGLPVLLLLEIFEEFGAVDCPQRRGE
jgi:hypothetical protein